MAHEMNDDVLNDEQAGDGYEEITSEEVDRVVEQLETLISQTESENIRSCLEEAADRIFALVYGDDADVVSEDASPLGEAA
ncbi:MAG: hypothetical protein KF774_08555 [Planctomyces sp.]|nr:hypothetical protein [Planctomyces sp.]